MADFVRLTDLFDRVETPPTAPASPWLFDPAPNPGTNVYDRARHEITGDRIRPRGLVGIWHMSVLDTDVKPFLENATATPYSFTLQCQIRMPLAAPSGPGSPNFIHTGLFLFPQEDPFVGPGTGLTPPGLYVTHLWNNNPAQQSINFIGVDSTGMTFNPLNGGMILPTEDELQVTEQALLKARITINSTTSLSIQIIFNEITYGVWNITDTQLLAMGYATGDPTQLVHKFGIAFYNQTEQTTELINFNTVSGIIAPASRQAIDSFVFIEHDVAVVNELFAEPTIPTQPTRTCQAVTDENDSSVLTLLDDIVATPTVIEHGHQVREQKFDDGFAVTHAATTNNRRRWSLRFSPMPNGDRVNLFNLYANTAQGSHSSFLWTHPHTNESIRLRFISEINWQLLAPGVWTAEVDVEEVHA